MWNNIPNHVVLAESISSCRLNLVYNFTSRFNCYSWSVNVIMCNFDIFFSEVLVVLGVCIYYVFFSLVIL